MVRIRKAVKNSHIPVLLLINHSPFHGLKMRKAGRQEIP
jgi:hypothetical protein